MQQIYARNVICAAAPFFPSCNNISNNLHTKFETFLQMIDEVLAFSQALKAEI